MSNALRTTVLLAALTALFIVVGGARWAAVSAPVGNHLAQAVFVAQEFHSL
jgi:hypothetical protein